MTKSLAALLIGCVCAAVLPSTLGHAAALRVAPIIVDVAKGATSTIELQNLAQSEAAVQVRIFRWQQKDGRNQLVPTRDVVASPPFTKIRPGRRNVIRIVRLSKRPVVGEESYRVLIDEIPKRQKGRAMKVGIALRYSLPVFFGANPISDTKLKWSVVQHNGQTIVKAVNPGARRVRLSALTLADRSGRILRFGKGLNGYVLGRSTATWKAKGGISARRNARVRITARTENGTIESEAKLRTAQ